MSLRYALLGLLAEGSDSGYGLTKRFEATLSRWAWHARHSQIYPELAKLADEGLIDVAEEGARGSRTYEITESGREDLRTWLLNPPGTPYVRSETTLRMVLLSTLEPADCRELLEAYEREAVTRSRELDQIVDRFEREIPGERLWYGRLAAEYGRLSYAAQFDWARWARGVVDEWERRRARAAAS